MKPRRPSLKVKIAYWFSALIFSIYAAGSILILVLYTREGRNDVALLLYSQAEALAGYVAASDRLDYPELQVLEPAELPVWLRVVADGRVVAATPGLPPFRLDSDGDTRQGSFETRWVNGEELAVVREAIWSRPGWAVEAVTTLAPLDARTRGLGLGLALTGLLLIPIVPISGWWLSAKALEPVGQLIEEIAALDSATLDQRLSTEASLSEIDQLAEAFNGLLDRLATSMERMERFTADASHELRTPVSILKAGIEVALRRPRSAEEYRATIGEALVEIGRLQRIVEGLLALARGHGGPAITTSPLVLAQLVASAAGEISLLAEERGVGIDADLDQSLSVDGNADMLRLLVLNLLDNAIRHAPEGSSIRVALDSSGPTARLQVIDRGPGVPESSRPFIFDRFYRGSAVPPSGLPTGGLGLSVVRWVAEAHGGSAALLETSPPGATFEVRLPLLCVSDASPAA